MKTTLKCGHLRPEAGAGAEELEELLLPLAQLLLLLLAQLLLPREQLLYYFRQTERNMLRYRQKLKEVSLTSHQEKFLRHMGEIKEQLALEKQAKKHPEENFTMTLDEKEQQIKVLQTQIKLLKVRFVFVPVLGKV